jgi:hypothetical protein
MKLSQLRQMIKEAVEDIIGQENIKAYYTALCNSEGVKPLPIKFGRVGGAGAATTYNTKTMKGLYITFDVNRLHDAETAIIHELTHQIKLETEGDAYVGKRDKLDKFRKLENKLIDKYLYSKYTKLLYNSK